MFLCLYCFWNCLICAVIVGLSIFFIGSCQCIRAFLSCSVCHTYICLHLYCSVWANDDDNSTTIPPRPRIGLPSESIGTDVIRSIRLRRRFYLSPLSVTRSFQLRDQQKVATCPDVVPAGRAVVSWINSSYILDLQGLTLYVAQVTSPAPLMNHQEHGWSCHVDAATKQPPGKFLPRDRRCASAVYAVVVWRPSVCPFVWSCKQCHGRERPLSDLEKKVQSIIYEQITTMWWRFGENRFSRSWDYGVISWTTKKKQ